MSEYLNPGNADFATNVKGKIYVDKSLAILEFNELFATNEKYICLSRPRRFGKTMMTNLMAAYYSKGCDSRHLFENLKLAQHEGWDEHLNKCNVISIDMNDEFSVYKRNDMLSEMIADLNRSIVKDLIAQFPSVGISESDDFSIAIRKVYDELGETFVVIIDEYDILIREEGVPAKLLDDYLLFLNNFFKGKRLSSAVSLAYLTGILPIIRVRVESKLNNFTEYTMLDPGQFAPYFGFSEGEVKELCDRFGMDYEQCRLMYDGYSFPGIGHVFNPRSLVQSLTKRRYDNYWTTTGAVENIVAHIGANIDGIQQDIIKLLNGEEVRVATFGYNNDIKTFGCKDDVFTYLIHLGYLAYDIDRKSCRIPNGEIRQAWFLLMSKTTNMAKVMKTVQASKKLLDDTLAGNAEAVAANLKVVHQEVSSALSYNRESSLQSAVLMAYFYARYQYIIVPEMPAGDGFADIAFIPTTPCDAAIIIELKMGDDPQVAINQIKARNYARLFSGYRYTGTILVGIAYSAESRTHKCIIEREK